MSVINRIPLINEILGKLTASQLGDLKDCINGEGGTPIFRSLKPISNEHLTTSDKGVKPISIELKTILGGMSVYEGYLIYTDEICYVICFSGDKNQGLNILKINPSTCEAEFVNGSLTILELRSELDDALDTEDGGGSSSGGTEVVANPELTGNESELTGLEVDDTKYKISQLTIPHSITVGTGADANDHDYLFAYLEKNNKKTYAPFGYSYVISFQEENGDSAGNTLFECHCAAQYITKNSILYSMNNSLKQMAISMGITLPTPGENANDFNDNMQFLLNALFSNSQSAYAYALLASLCNQDLSTLYSLSDGKYYKVILTGGMATPPVIIDGDNNNQITSVATLLANASIKYASVQFF